MVVRIVNTHSSEPNTIGCWREKVVMGSDVGLVDWGFAGTVCRLCSCAKHT